MQRITAMVNYIAFCRNEEEASRVLSQLNSACPTLVFSRTLKRPHELDLFNADLLRAADEDIFVGYMILESRPSLMQRVWAQLGIWFKFSLFETVSTAVWKAHRWLCAGRPVVLAASDDGHDEHIKLPKNIVHFHIPSHKQPRKIA